MTEELEERLTLLGHPTQCPRCPDEARLEWVPNPHPGTLYVVRFTCPEFTSICPVTGQPDFAHLVIEYVPKERLVESKSLKLFLGSFRNHGVFHEDCSLLIAKRLEKVLDPSWLRLGGYWYPRGGMPIDVFCQSGSLREESGYLTRMWLPIVGGDETAKRLRGRLR
jgi:7-cyano-7-deazaguanine reductase